MTNKIIALVDCNNFYVSCERIFNPKLYNKPVVVLSNNDGCIISRSEEAKLLDIPMGAPYFKVQHIVNKHNVHVYSSNFPLYGSISNRVMQILEDTVPNIERYSIDEAFLDLSYLKPNEIEDFSKFIIDKLIKYISIPVSVGIGPTKTLAKLANSIAKAKPTKSFIILNEQLRIKVLKESSVKEIWGIGLEYSKFLINNHILTAYTLTLVDDVWIRKHMSIIGLKIVKELRGEMCLELEENIKDKKSITVSRSFSEYITSFEDLVEPLVAFVSKGAEKLRQSNLVVKTIGVMIRTTRYGAKDHYYSNYASISLIESTDYTPELITHATCVLKSLYKPGYKYKKLGIILFDLDSKSHKQVSLFTNKAVEKKKQSLMHTIDAINMKSNLPKLFYASRGQNNRWLPKQDKVSKNYICNWNDLPIVKA